MPTSQTDIKLLWDRSANRCAICHCELSQDKARVSGSFPLGEQAHIVAKTEDGPRGRSVLSPDERESYHNLLLLCPNHHTEADKNVEDYPAERLHFIKSKHELWVRETLSGASEQKRLAADLVYTNLIDMAVHAAQLRRWETWTSRALAPIPAWPYDAPDRIFKFAQKTVSALWPESHPELKRSIQHLATVLNHAVNVFQEHCEERHGKLVAVRFYKIEEWDPARYDRLIKRWNSWVEECHRLVHEATKAANWFADVVRRDINPMFFALEGRFRLTEGPFRNLMVRVSVPQYSRQERDNVRESFLKRVRRWQNRRSPP